MKSKTKKISKTKIEKAMQRKINPDLRKLILKLKKKKQAEWLHLAYLLAKPKRKSIAVNIFKINKFSKENDIIIVPGKVLSNEDMEHKITIAAFSFSDAAKQKLKKTGCEIKTISELADKNTKFKIII